MLEIRHLAVLLGFVYLIKCCLTKAPDRGSAIAKTCPWGNPACLPHSHACMHAPARTHTHLASGHNLPAYLTPKQTLPLLCQRTQTDQSASVVLLSSAGGKWGFWMDFKLQTTSVISLIPFSVLVN